MTDNFYCQKTSKLQKIKSLLYIYIYYNDDFFDSDKLSDDEFLVEFRFLKNDVYQLSETLQSFS